MNGRPGRRSSRRRANVAAIAACFGAPFLGGAAFATTPTESAAAQALFDEARQLASAGKFSEACPKFEESQRLDPGSGTLLNLAACYESEGRLASAWSSFLEAEAIARSSGNVERATAARERAAALAPKLSKIAIRVADGGLQGLEIRRDGEPVRNAQWGLAVPTDAGPHTITATAPGRKAWQTTLTVPQDASTTPVLVPQLLPEVEGAPVAQPATALPASRSEDVGTSGGGLGSQKAVALAAGGVGIVGVALGSLFGLQSKSKHDDAEAYCSGSTCTDPRGIELTDQSIRAGNLSTAMFIVGAAGVTGGAVLWLTARPTATPAPQVALGPGTAYLRVAW